MPTAPASAALAGTTNHRNRAWATGRSGKGATTGRGTTPARRRRAACKKRPCRALWAAAATAAATAPRPGPGPRSVLTSQSALPSRSGSARPSTQGRPSPYLKRARSSGSKPCRYPADLQRHPIPTSYPLAERWNPAARPSATAGPVASPSPAPRAETAARNDGRTITKSRLSDVTAIATADTPRSRRIRLAFRGYCGPRWT